MLSGRCAGAGVASAARSGVGKVSGWLRQGVWGKRGKRKRKRRSGCVVKDLVCIAKKFWERVPRGTFFVCCSPQVLVRVHVGTDLINPPRGSRLCSKQLLVLLESALALILLVVAVFHSVASPAQIWIEIGK